MVFYEGKGLSQVHLVVGDTISSSGDSWGGILIKICEKFASAHNLNYTIRPYNSIYDAALALSIGDKFV